MSNADFIRNMTNEELSKFLCENTNCQTCKFCTWSGCCIDEWLGKEHDDDD